MINQNIKKTALLLFAFVFTAVALSCSSEPERVAPGVAQTPTEAYRMLFTAVKNKNTEEIKMMMSKNSLGLAEFAGSQQKKPIEEVLRNGFSETTMAETMPKIRDEQANENFASVEVFNQKANKWEVVPFIKEDGGWKAAFGDMFKGNWQAPGKPMSMIEQENANSANPNLVPMSNVNMNVNTAEVTPIVPKPATNVNVSQVNPTLDKNVRVQRPMAGNANANK